MELLFGLIVFVILGCVGAFAKGTVDKDSVDHYAYEKMEDISHVILKWGLILLLPGIILIWYLVSMFDL